MRGQWRPVGKGSTMMVRLFLILFSHLFLPTVAVVAQ